MMRKTYIHMILGLLGALLIGACGPDSSEGAGSLSVTPSGDGVVAYRSGWDQAYILRKSREPKSFVPAGRPTLSFATPDKQTALLIDPARGWLTAVRVTDGTVKRYPIRANRDTAKFSSDSRFVLLHASGKVYSGGGFDPNELSIVDLSNGRYADLSVGTNPKAVSFFYKGGDPRVLLFSPGKMTQIRIEELFRASPSDEAWRQTRNLSNTVDANQVPLAIAQTESNVFVAVAGLQEFLSVSLDSEDALPPVNFEITDVDSPRSLALSPPVPATAETVFFRDNAAETRFLYVLNSNRSLTVFDTANLGRARVVNFSHVVDMPDTVHPTADGKRVLIYKRIGARELYRMNLRTGHVATIPFSEQVREFVHAPDGKSVIAIHEDSASFTYVNFTHVFEPIQLPSVIADYALTEDGGSIVFGMRDGGPPKVFDLKRGLLDDLSGPAFRRYGTASLGSTGGTGLFFWLDDRGGRIVFLDLQGGSETQANFHLDGILDR